MLSTEVLFSLFLGFLVALWFEKYYVGRASVLPNVAVIFFLMWPSWAIIHNFVKWWLYIGIFLGIIALTFLLKKKGLPGWIYDSTYPFYSGKTIMGIYTPIIIFKEYFPDNLFSNLFWIVVGILTIGTWFIGVKYLDNGIPFKKVFT